MYPDFLPDNDTPHWGADEIFTENQLICAFIEDDYSIGMHTQGFFEFNIVLNGKGRHYIGNQNLQVQKGDTFVIPPNVRHGYFSEDRLDVYHILMNQTFFDKYMSDLQTLPYFHTLFNIEPLMRSAGGEPLYLKLSEKQLSEISYPLETMRGIRFARSAPDAIICNSCCMMLIARLCSAYAGYCQTGRGGGPQNNDTLFMKSISLVYEKYYEKITVERLAKTAVLSKTAYINLFKKVMGTTPAKFLTERRLEAAKSMLANTSLSLKDIAESAGFYDPAHFVRSFIKHLDCTPGEFREKSRGTAGK